MCASTAESESYYKRFDEGHYHVMMERRTLMHMARGIHSMKNRRIDNPYLFS